MRFARVLPLVLAPALLATEGGELTIGNAEWNGVRLRFVTRLEPPSTSGRDGLSGAATAGNGRGRHIIIDHANKRYFGYDVSVDYKSDSQTALIRIEPLTAPRNSLERFDIDATWTAMSLPQYPKLRQVRIGDTVALDLLVNPTTGQKIVDYLTVLRAGFEGEVATRKPKDFSLEDVQLTLDRARISVDGKVVEASTRNLNKLTGKLVSFYLPGRGRFLISLFPDAGVGFHLAGVAAEETLKFKNGATEYRLDCAARIAPGQGVYNVYVLHDASWRPKGDEAGAEYLIGAADQAESSSHKR